MATWKKHRFYGLHEHQDEQDKIIAGLEFSVHYVGCTYVEDDYEKTKKLLAEFLKNTVALFQRSKLSKIQLVVDVSGAVFYDCHGVTLECFKLVNIRDVIYCDNTNEYANYFMLVGQAEGDLTVKARLLVCKNKEEAKCLHKTFVETFKLGAYMSRIRTHESNEKLFPVYEGTNASAEEMRSIFNTSSANGINCLDNSKQFPFRENQNVGRHQEMGTQDNIESYLEDDFTEFARLRSRNTPLFASGNEERYTHS